MWGGGVCGVVCVSGVCVRESDLLSRLFRLMEVLWCVSSFITAFLFIFINIMTLSDQQKTD